MTASSISSFGLSQCAVMQARSALFDLYGDYLRPRGGRAPVAALVKLLAPLGIAAPAVRTAVSRMVRQGWLHPLRLGSGPGYLLTPKAARWPTVRWPPWTCGWPGRPPTPPRWPAC